MTLKVRRGRDETHSMGCTERGLCVYICVYEEKEGRMRDEDSQPGCVLQCGGGCCSSSGSLAVTQH